MIVGCNNHVWCMVGDLNLITFLAFGHPFPQKNILFLQLAFSSSHLAFCSFDLAPTSSLSYK